MAVGSFSIGGLCSGKMTFRVKIRVWKGEIFTAFRLAPLSLSRNLQNKEKKWGIGVIVGKIGKKLNFLPLEFAEWFCL